MWGTPDLQTRYILKVTWPIGVLIYLAIVDKVLARFWSRHKPTALPEINMRVFNMW